MTSQQRRRHQIRHRVETGKIRKSSWKFSPPIVHVQLTQFCVSFIHIPPSMRKGVTLTEEGGPTMHSSPQVPRCFFQSEPPPLSVSSWFAESRTLREGRRDQLLGNNNQSSYIGRCRVTSGSSSSFNTTPTILLFIHLLFHFFLLF